MMPILPGTLQCRRARVGLCDWRASGAWLHYRPLLALTFRASCLFAGHWGKSGPPSLSVIAARVLRRRLLEELDSLEPAVRGKRCCNRASSAAPTARALQPPPPQGRNGYSGDCGATDSADASEASSGASQASERSTGSGGGGSATPPPQPGRPATNPPAGHSGISGGNTAMASVSQPRQLSGLLPALSVASPGPLPAADPFAASGVVVAPPVQPSPPPPPQQQQPQQSASFVFSSFSPFSGYTGRGFDDELQNPNGGVLPRSNSLLSLSIRPAPSATGSAATPQHSSMAGHWRERSSLEAGLPAQPSSLQGRRSSRRLPMASARSLVAGSEGGLAH